MSTTQPQYDLAELAERYEILGELAGGDAATVVIARRRDDGADVQITVFTAPQGDEGNALSHLAADVNLLGGATHPGLVPILDGVWVGQDAFAIVTRRITAPTLDELLLKREEVFSLPRIAAVLSQVNGTITWARERRVVHRCVTPRTIFIEPGTDRPLVAFTARALPLTEMPGAEEDARTIAQVARVMLTRGGGAAAEERAEQPLGELRPGLPAVVVTQTEQLLSPSRESGVPDVIGYIGAIAMADALKAGEEHLERTHNLIEEQKREHQTQLETERREHDLQLADEQAKHKKAVDDQAKKFQKEREEFERQIRKDNEALAKERAALATEREAHRRDCERLTRERDEHEREMTRVREQLEWEAAALATQQELYAQTDELKTPVGDERPLLVSKPAREPVRIPDGPSRLGQLWSQRPAWLGRPMTAAAIAVLVVLIAVAAVALNRSRGPGAAVATETSRARVVDSVAGGVEQLPPAEVSSVATGVPGDLLASVVARADSTPEIPWWRRVLRRSRPRDTVPSTPRLAADTAPKLDTMFAAPPVRAPLDTLIRRDTIRRDTIRRDTLRRDTSVTRDTTRRDTTLARDTLP
jgi:hypothetical protein